MCGINGIFSTNPISNIGKRIKSMNDSTKHRGPDYQSYEQFGKTHALGHNRLKIIDLSDAANQPMTDENNYIGLVFNGEIYNFKEIKKELNYNFKTNSDTEVILAAVRQNGIDWFLKKANGMFAIALYYSDSNKLFLIRDRFGIKPLYYCISDDTMIFSSEIKGVLNSGLVEAVFNEAAIDPYLANRYVYEPYTFFKNIYQVKSSHYLEFTFADEILCKETKYWNLPHLNFEKNYNEKTVLKELKPELMKAIKRRLTSDVPLGTYLSGGVDSSLLTAITALEMKEKINTYTIGFPQEQYNEFEYSNKVAKKYDTNHHTISMDLQQYFEKWKELIEYKDAPLAVPNEIPLATMSTNLKEKITVVLSGEGADELFGGYGRIFRFPFYHKNNCSNDFYEAFIQEYEYVPRSLRDDFLILDKSLRDKFDAENKIRLSGLRNEEKIFVFFHERHIKGLLHRLDMTTMQTAVEGRVPFLDHELVEHVYKNIPYELKLRWKEDQEQENAKYLHPKQYSEIKDIPKYILRQLAYEYLPAEIIERKKMGFPVPLKEWYKEIIQQHQKLLQRAEWINQEKLDKLLQEAETHERSGQIIWMLLNIEIFKEKYFTKEWRW